MLLSHAGYLRKGFAPELELHGTEGSLSVDRITGELRFANNPDDPLLADYAELLYGYGLLAEGSELHDPIRYNQLVSDLMLKSL